MIFNPSTARPFERSSAPTAASAKAAQSPAVEPDGREGAGTPCRHSLGTRVEQGEASRIALGRCAHADSPASGSIEARVKLSVSARRIEDRISVLLGLAVDLLTVGGVVGDDGDCVPPGGDLALSGDLRGSGSIGLGSLTRWGAEDQPDGDAQAEPGNGAEDVEG